MYKMEPIRVTIYYRDGCPYSELALAKLEELTVSKKIECFRKYNSGDKSGQCFKTMVSKSNGVRTYPQIFAKYGNDKETEVHIGGYDDLIEHLKKNKGKIIIRKPSIDGPTRIYPRDRRN